MQLLLLQNLILKLLYQRKNSFVDVFQIYTC